MKSNTSPTAPGCRYGRLFVLSEVALGQTPAGKRYRRWLCRCDCGRERIVRQDCLRNGMTISCGCRMLETLKENRRTLHGKWQSREFRLWGGMIERCRFHPRYLGRGLRVCDRWRHSFAAFLEDMGERPSPEHSLDRIDNDRGYTCGRHDLCADCGATGEPANVRWATHQEQNRNMATNRWLTFRGETLCLTDWARRAGISKETLRQRLRKGWSLERALTQPLLRR